MEKHSINPVPGAARLKVRAKVGHHHEAPVEIGVLVEGTVAGHTSELLGL